MINNILIVCMGNICRSPIAEGLFKQYATSHKLSLSVSSAGITACVGQSAHLFAQQLMLEKSMDISDHRAQQLNEELLRKADLVLVMEQSQLTIIKNQFPFTQGKLFTLGKWSNFEIPDPINRTLNEFQAIFKLIEQGTREWQTKLWNLT